MIVTLIINILKIGIPLIKVVYLVVLPIIPTNLELNKYDLY